MCGLEPHSKSLQMQRNLFLSINDATLQVIETLSKRYPSSLVDDPEFPSYRANFDSCLSLSGGISIGRNGVFQSVVDLSAVIGGKPCPNSAINLIICRSMDSIRYYAESIASHQS